MFTIRKAARAPSARAVFLRKAKKSAAGKDALKKLNDYLNANTAEPMYFLQNMWGNQQNAITYKELREAILNGYMDEKTLQAWQQDYAKFVVNRLAPIWQNAAAAGAAATAAGKAWAFDAGGVGMTKWIADRGDRWVTGITQETRAAMQALIGASTTGQYTVDELSRAIRPLIGLNEPQAKANLRYYNTVKANLLENTPNMREATAEKRAREAALKYQQRQLMQRATMISQTELAAAYSAGNREFVRQAQAKGLMGRGVWVWDTAADEAVCPTCGSLNGAKSNADGQYSIGGRPVNFRMGNHPPAHPRCRCAEHFEETEAAVKQTEEVERLRVMPEEMRVTELGGADGGRQRAALVQTVMTDDIDLDALYRARVFVDFDNANYTATIRSEITLKSLTELAESGIITVSNEALEHSTIGSFNSVGRITGGCHAQAGMEELTRRGIEYVVVGAFSNGVRLGNIPSHKEGFKQKGGRQAWFPIGWDDTKIMEAGTAVANSDAPLLENHYKIGEYEGVLVRVELHNGGSIKSVCPDYDQGTLNGVEYTTY